MTVVPRRVRVAEELPEIVEHLDVEHDRWPGASCGGADHREDRQRQAPALVDRPGHLGLLVLDGLPTPDVILEKPLAAELVGQGDLLRPSDRDGEDAPIPFGVSWTGSSRRGFGA